MIKLRISSHYTRLGKSITRTCLPMAVEGRLRRKITRTYSSTPSQSAYSSVASVSAHHLTPDGAVVSTVLHGGGLRNRENTYTWSQTATYLVDVDNALTEVELGVLLGVHSLHLDEVLVGVLKNLGSTT